MSIGDDKSPYTEAPGWNEELASDSEAIVKAERCMTNDSVGKLQQSSVDYLQKKERKEQQGEIAQMAIESELIMEEYFELERDGVSHEPQDEDRQEYVLGQRF